MYKHTFYYFLGNKKYPEIYILRIGCVLAQQSTSDVGLCMCVLPFTTWLKLPSWSDNNLFNPCKISLLHRYHYQMCRNTCLSLSCNTYLSFNAIYLPKVIRSLLSSAASLLQPVPTINVYEQKCLSTLLPPVIVSWCQEHLGLMSLLKEANLVLNGEWPALHLFFSNCFLHLCLLLEKK